MPAAELAEAKPTRRPISPTTRDFICYPQTTIATSPRGTPFRHGLSTDYSPPKGPAAENCRALARLKLADDDSTTRDEGQQLLDSLCHRGDPRACMVLADHLQNTDRPDDEIIATFERACDTGDRLGCRTLATHLIDHHRDDEHHTLIVDALEEHCHPGDTRNCDLLVSYFADRGDDLHTQSCRVYYQQLDMR